MFTKKFLALATAALALAACGDNLNTPPNFEPDDSNGETPTIYGYESRFMPGESSVSYSGQTFRHVLVTEMIRFIGGLTDRIDSQDFTPTANQTREALEFYYDFDGTTSGQSGLSITAELPLLQSVYDDIASGKDLRGKIAGNDPVGQHKDWTSEFVGWSEGGVSSPDELIGYWLDVLDGLAADRASGAIPTGPDGHAISKVYITPQGQDIAQLLQKFLLGAIALSQGTDDYLDDDTAGKGLQSSNLRDGDKAYSALEHAWDEGFGYFGAARDYNDYTDDEIAGKGGRGEYQNGYFDSNGDGKIDLHSEYNFGHAVNAAKRDRDSSPQAPTDLTKSTFDAFLAGRAIIAQAEGELDNEQMAALLEQRDIAVAGWEKAIAATVVHYVNDTLQDMNAFGSDDYSFADHAKHWSELKGFALGLQFSPFSPLTDAQFVELHQHIGDAPVLPNAEAAEIAAYRQSLLMARTLIGTAYEFDAANLGDDNGENGW